jgi:hypothetical protein
LVAEVDRDKIVRGEYALDVVGHYARPDIWFILFGFRDSV